MLSLWTAVCAAAVVAVAALVLRSWATDRATSTPRGSPVTAGAGHPRTVGECTLLTPLRLRGLVLRNRVVRAAAFGGARPEDLAAAHGAAAAGGVGMTIVAYGGFCAWGSVM